MSMIANPRIAELLRDLGTLSTFAGAAAASAAEEITPPVSGAAPAVLDDLIGAYKADEQADRGALFKGAVAKMETVVSELKRIDVLVEPYSPPQPAPVAQPAAPVVEPGPAAEPAPAAPVEPAP